MLLIEAIFMEIIRLSHSRVVSVLRLLLLLLLLK